MPNRMNNMTARAMADEELNAYERDFGWGRAVSIARVRRLVTQKVLDRARRADAWELLGHLYIDAGEDDLAIEAYDHAFKVGRSTEFLISKADLLRDRGIDEARRLLAEVDVADIPANRHRYFWVSLMDTAMVSFDEEFLREVVRRIWKRDLNDEVVKGMKERCERLIEMLPRLGFRSSKNGTRVT